MTIHHDRRTFLAITGGALAGLAAGPAVRAASTAKGRGLVVGHREGAEAGMEILAEGGNAVDAIVAAALVAGVIAVPKCGVGGYGGHLTVGMPNGKLGCIDFNSEAPAAARADMFPVDEQGKVKGDAHNHGWLSAGVPGTLAGLQLALHNYGSQSFSHVVQPAIRYARNGFPVDDVFKFWLDRAADSLQRDPASARLFFRDGKPLEKGDTYRNPDLADMLERLAEKGSVDDFYHGQIARQIAAAFKKNGGIVTAKDMAAYHALELAPLSLDWQGHTIATAPLTAGGLTILQTMADLKALGSDWDRLSVNDPKRTQAWIEALRIAWGDRLELFGDPRFVDVPVKRLLSEKYAEESADKVRAAVAERRPVPVKTNASTADGTVNLSAVDSGGMMAAMTLTHGEAFGARVTIPGLGILLGHGISRFEAVPGRRNSIAPGKRPLDNMSPSIVLKGGRPTLAIGGVGSRRIPNAVFEVLLKLITDGSSLEAAANEPRIHTEGGLDLYVEPGRPAAELDYLKQVGYTIKLPKPSLLSAVQIDPSDRTRPAVGFCDYASDHTNPPGNRNPHVTMTHSG